MWRMLFYSLLILAAAHGQHTKSLVNDTLVALFLSSANFLFYCDEIVHQQKPLQYNKSRSDRIRPGLLLLSHYSVLEIPIYIRPLKAASGLPLPSAVFYQDPNGFHRDLYGSLGIGFRSITVIFSPALLIPYRIHHRSRTDAS